MMGTKDIFYCLQQLKLYLLRFLESLQYVQQIGIALFSLERVLMLQRE